MLTEAETAGFTIETAVTVATPTPTALTVPFPFTMTTAGAEVLQTTDGGFGLPKASLTKAETCLVVPRPMVTGDGATVMLATAAMGFRNSSCSPRIVAITSAR